MIECIVRTPGPIIAPDYRGMSSLICALAWTFHLEHVG